MFRFYSSPTSSNRVAVVGKHENGALKIAVARCGKKEQFIRRKGRLIAEGRLNKGRYYKTVEMKECDINKFVEIAKEIATEVETKGVVNNVVIHIVE